MISLHLGYYKNIITHVKRPGPIKSKAEHWNNNNKPEHLSSPVQVWHKDEYNARNAGILWNILQSIIQPTSFRLNTAVCVFLFVLNIFNHFSNWKIYFKYTSYKSQTWANNHLSSLQFHFWFAKQIAVLRFLLVYSCHFLLTLTIICEKPKIMKKQQNLN